MSTENLVVLWYIDRYFSYQNKQLFGGRKEHLGKKEDKCVYECKRGHDEKQKKIWQDKLIVFLAEENRV